MFIVSLADYKFLGILKGMFPDIPILGLTATSTSKITIDVQKMLCIQGCLVLKASFNRPNLYYEVWNVRRNE
jgi:ATP-dependent DNA helicase Q1